MVLSALLAVLALSGFLSAVNFRFLRAVARIPTHCYAGEPFPISIQIHNEKRAFPTFSISLASAEDSPFRFSKFYVPLIRPLDRMIQTGQAMLPKRGRHRLRAVKVSSRYPFGFFSKGRNYEAEAECICYPAILPEEQLSLSGVDLQGSSQRFERGFGQDLYMIRDYVPSDSARHVHWKASAKTSMLKTREYAAEASRRIVIAFDRFGHPGDIEHFERLVSEAASVAYYLIRDGVEVRFVTDEWEGGDIESILEYLALTQVSSSAQPPQTENAALSLSLRGSR